MTFFACDSKNDTYNNRGRSKAELAKILANAFPAIKKCQERSKERATAQERNTP